MEIKFNPGQTPVEPATAPTAAAPVAAAPAADAPAPVATPAPAPAPQVPALVNKNTSLGPTGILLGDKIPSFKEIIMPRINISQNIGELNKTFSPGHIVLGRQTILFAPPAADKPATPPVVITVFGFLPTRFSEKVSGAVAGMTVDSEEAVLQAGGTLDYKEWELKKAAGMKLFQPLADAFVAIQRPAHCADDGTVFTYDVEGNKYALALWAMKGSSYTEAAKRVFFTGRAVGILKPGGYPSYAFSLATKEKVYPNGNRAWVPICLPVRKNTAAFLDFVRSVIGAPEGEATPA
jgi:hypothetical protein